jgi:hypothetical protein
MRKSRFTSGSASGLLRLCEFVLPAVLGLSVAAVTAQQYSLVGQWRGVYQGITMTIVIQPNGQYSQLLQSGTAMTQQSGPYRLVAPNTIIFSVTDWAPRTQQIYHPIGTAGGYYTTELTAKPPGATDTYVFNGPNTITLTDQMTHGSIMMTRVP